MERAGDYASLNRVNEYSFSGIDDDMNINRLASDPGEELREVDVDIHRYSSC
jgi:hypothetical protein